MGHKTFAGHQIKYEETITDQRSVIVSPSSKDRTHPLYQPELNLQLRILKVVLAVLTDILTIPPVVSFHVKCLFVDERKAMRATSQLMGLIPGNIGILARYSVYKRILKSVGANCSIGFGVIFSTHNVILGNNVYIAPFAEIGQAVIHDSVLIGHHVCIVSGRKQHRMVKVGNRLTLSEGTYSTVTIGESAWINPGSIIGANVGHNCIVGAGAVVVKDIEPYSVAVGNPAKVIKTVNPDDSLLDPEDSELSLGIPKDS
jgi:acetyltransferase-like isoleucine patch superfamily enzyme